MISIQKQKVVVIGHGSTSRLGLIRSAGELGCEVIVIVITSFWPYTKKLKTVKPFDCYSKYVSHVHYCPFQDEEGLIRLLLNRCRDAEQKVIILPSSDFAAAMVDRNRGRLSDDFFFPHIDGFSSPVLQWMDKERQKDVARSVGLDVPGSRVIALKGGAYQIPAGINYPCFTKALVTLVGGKQCFNCCDNERELRHALDAIGAVQDVRILVEDYKEIETEYAVCGFSDGKEVVIPGIIQILTQTVSHFGIARTGEIFPVSGYDQLVEQFKAFVRKIGFVGLFDIDFYYSGGTFYFAEMNLRFGGSGYAVTRAGVNLPAMLIRHFRGESYSGMQTQIEKTATFVNERMCEDDWCAGDITSREFHQILSSTDIRFVEDAADPEPEKMFRLTHQADRVKKPLKKLLRR